MQTLQELKLHIHNFNEYIFNKGYEFVWDNTSPKVMKTNIADENFAKKDLMVLAMHDPSYSHDIELIFKKCTEHNFEKNFYMHDSWDSKLLKLVTYILDDNDLDEEKCFVLQYIIHFYVGGIETYYHTISAQSFYYFMVN